MRRTGDRYKRGDGRSYSPLYGTWNQMLDRCNNPDNARYDRYGARGITVCERWHIFANFKEDMGLSPAGHTLDRIDNTLGYFPNNCRWATPAEQNRNMSSNIWVVVNGERLIMTDVMRKLGFSVSPFYNRVNRHKETPQQAIDFLVNKYRHKLEEQLKRDD